MLLLAATITANAQKDSILTVNVSDKTVSINSDKEKTTVKVYNNQGNELVKTRELEFVDGKEIEQVYVGSPFLKTSSLQRVQLFPKYYYIDAGWTMANAGPFKKQKDSDNLYTNGAFSIGFGMNCLAIPFDKTFTSGLTVGLGLKYMKFNIQDNMKITKISRGNISFNEIDNDARKNHIEYTALTIPVMYNLTNSRYSKWNIGMGLAPEIRLHSQYVFTPHSGKTERTNGVVNTFGLNAELMYNFNPFTVRLSYDLLPAFKTGEGFNAHTSSITIGIDIIGLGKLFHKSR